MGTHVLSVDDDAKTRRPIARLEAYAALLAEIAKQPTQGRDGTAYPVAPVRPAILVLALLLAACQPSFSTPPPAPTTSQSHAAAPQDDLGRLIDRLGSDGLDDRVAAEQELLRRGAAALDALEKAATSHAEPDVRARAQSLADRLSLTRWGRIAAITDDAFLLIDPHTLAVRRVGPSGMRFFSAVWTPTGRELVLGGLLVLTDDGAKRTDTALLRVDAIAGNDIRTALSACTAGYSYTPDGRASRDVYSPDGSKALVAGSAPELRVIEVATGKKLAGHRIPNAWKTHECAWSVDGRTVAFTASRRVEGQGVVSVSLYLADPDFASVRESGREVSCLTWSADSKTILCTSDRWPPDRPKDVIVIDVTTGKRTVVAGDAIAGEVPRLSPDGRRIAYVRQKDDTKEVVVMNSDGTGAKVVARGTDVVWSPDGSTVACLDGALCLTELASGTTRRSVTVKRFDWSCAPK